MLNNEQDQFGFSRKPDRRLFYQQPCPSCNSQNLKNVNYGKIPGRLDPLVGDERQFDKSLIEQDTDGNQGRTQMNADLLPNIFLFIDDDRFLNLYGCNKARCSTMSWPILNRRRSSYRMGDTQRCDMLTLNFPSCWAGRPRTCPSPTSKTVAASIKS